MMAVVVVVVVVVNEALAGVKGVDQHGRLARQESYTGFILELQQSPRGLTGQKDPSSL